MNNETNIIYCPFCFRLRQTFCLPWLSDYNKHTSDLINIIYINNILNYINMINIVSIINLIIMKNFILYFVNVCTF